MSTPVRTGLLVLVACLLLALKVHQPAPAAPEERRAFAPFPERVVARATPLPEYADGARTRIVQQLTSVNAMWTTAFVADGEVYEAPHLADAIAGDCGAPSGTWAALYCVPRRSILVDVDAHVQRHLGLGAGASDLVLGYIVAHEVAHHVQVLRGAPRDETLALELHADCLAGVWGKAVGLPLPPTWAYGEDAEHGTATQRIQSLNAGYRAARPADCDAAFSA